MELIGKKVKKEELVKGTDIIRVDVPIGSDISLWINLNLKGGTVNKLDIYNNKVLVSVDKPEFGSKFQRKYNGKKLRLFIRNTPGNGEEFQEVAVKCWNNHFYGLEIDLL